MDEQGSILVNDSVYSLNISTEMLSKQAEGADLIWMSMGGGDPRALRTTEPVWCV